MRTTRLGGRAGASEDDARRARAVGRVWTENRPSSRRIVVPDLQELYRYRELAVILALRDLQVRYKQTFFGVAWAIVQPLAGAVVFAVVFGRVVDLSSGQVPYVVFAYSGMVVWTYFSTALDSAANSLVNHQSLVTKVYFPRLLSPLAAVLPGVVDLCFTLTVLAVLCVAFDVTPGVQVLLTPLVVLAGVCLAFGVGALLAAVNVRYRDVRYALGFLVQLWFYASPVAYPGTLVTGDLEWLYALNPLVGLLDTFRWVTLDAAAPGSEALLSLAVGMTLTTVGVLYFLRAERRFADVI